MRKLAYLLVPFLFLAGPVLADVSKDPKVAQAMAAAEAAIEKAKSVNNIWRDTEKFYSQAQEAAKKGEREKALSLAEKARQEGVMAYEQALSERRVFEQLKAASR